MPLGCLQGGEKEWWGVRTAAVIGLNLGARGEASQSAWRITSAPWMRSSFVSIFGPVSGRFVKQCCAREAGMVSGRGTQRWDGQWQTSHATLGWSVAERLARKGEERVRAVEVGRGRVEVLERHQGECF